MYDPQGGIAIDYPSCLIMQQNGDKYEFFSLMLTEVIPSSILKKGTKSEHTILDLNEVMEDIQKRHLNDKNELHVAQKGLIFVEW